MATLAVYSAGEAAENGVGEGAMKRNPLTIDCRIRLGSCVVSTCVPYKGGCGARRRSSSTCMKTSVDGNRPGGQRVMFVDYIRAGDLSFFFFSPGAPFSQTDRERCDRSLGWEGREGVGLYLFFVVRCSQPQLAALGFQVVTP